MRAGRSIAKLISAHCQSLPDGEREHERGNDGFFLADTLSWD